jgi:hypothetical protein
MSSWNHVPADTKDLLYTQLPVHSPIHPSFHLSIHLESDLKTFEHRFFLGEDFLGLPNLLGLAGAIASNPSCHPVWARDLWIPHRHNF